MQTTIICGAGYVSGKEIMALELGEGLIKEKHQVDFITSYWHNGDFQKRLQGRRIEFKVLPIGFISATLNLACLRMTAEQVWRWPGLLIQYRRFLKEKTPDQIIHTNWHHLLLVWPFLNSKRDIFWVHEAFPDKPQYRHFFCQLQSRLKCFVAVSHSVAMSLKQIGVSEENIKVIHNGLSDPCPNFTENRLTQELRLGIVGQVGAWKGHEDLFDAFGMILKKHPRAELHIIGRGNDEYETLLKTKADRLGIAKNLRWRGFISDRFEIFDSLDVCVVPSRCAEGFGLVASEAGFFGLPVVASRRGGLSEIVDDGATGLLVEAEHPTQLANSLIKLLDDPALCRRMGVAARKRMLGEFSQKRLSTDFAKLMVSE